MAGNNPFTEITQEILDLTQLCLKNNNIDPGLYNKYEVKRGLRDLNGKGVLTGLTEISEIRSTVKDSDGNDVPCEGKLFYRGYDVEELVAGFVRDKRFGFEDIFISSPADDASTVLVPEGTQELTYRASISENAQLYINGEPVEEVGTINIENISEINVKVVSEDGRFEALKTYRLQIQQEVK